MTDMMISTCNLPFSFEQTPSWTEIMYNQPQDGKSVGTSSIDAFGVTPDSYVSMMMMQHSVMASGSGLGLGVDGSLPMGEGTDPCMVAIGGSSAPLHDGGAQLGTGLGEEAREETTGRVFEQGQGSLAPNSYPSYEAPSCVHAPVHFTTTNFEFDFTVPSSLYSSHSTAPHTQQNPFSLADFHFTSSIPSTTTTTDTYSSSTNDMSTILFPSFELSTKRSAEETDAENDVQGSAKKPRVVAGTTEVLSNTVNPRDLCNTPTPPITRPPSPPRTHTCRPAVSSPLSSAPAPPIAPPRPRRRSSRSNQIALLKFALDPWLRLSRNLGPQSGSGVGSAASGSSNGGSCRPTVFNPATWPSAGNLRELRNSDPFAASFGTGLDMGMGGMGVGDFHTHQWNLVDA
ncbi:hypothetical protein FRB95_014533 [Tulasnella sp. JGI-2019a]|nr:hypothetical protein FRB93_003905 [Tulasnella sp. JGI-2019a]KAG9033645.1 hypothetical protein FRB95_014533 [Tulasnella sp. JGI-2019a]